METTLDTEEQLCPLTLRLMEAVESPVENCLKHHQSKLAELLASVEQETGVALLKIRLSEAPIQRKILLKLKTEIINKLDSLAMSSDRRQYLLHQLSYVQDINELASLIQLINHKQIEQLGVIVSGISNAESMIEILEKNQQDLILITQSTQGIILSKQSFSLVAGVFTDQINKVEMLTIRNLANQNQFLIINHELKINENLVNALQSVELKGKKLSQSTVAITGATGNVMTIVAELIAGRVGKLILLHHSPIEVSLRFQKTLSNILNQILKIPINTELTSTIKLHWTNGKDLVNFLNHPEIQSVFQAKADLDVLKDADIVLCGNCPTSGFMRLDHFQKNTVIIDMTPSSVFDQEMKKEMSLSRTDISYHTIFSTKNLVLS